MAQTFKTASLLKKISLVLIIGFFAFFVFLVSVPFWFNVERYRPQIVKAVEPYIQGKIELGELSLSFLGNFNVAINGIKITDRLGGDLLSAGSVKLTVPLTSIWKRSPSLTLQLKNPKIHLVKDKNGKWNIEDALNIENKADAIAKPQLPSNGQLNETNENSIPSWLLGSQLNLSLTEAQIDYLDNLKGTKQSFKNINIEGKQISLTHPSEFYCSLNVNVPKETGVQIVGPLKILGEVVPTAEEQTGWNGKIIARADFKPLVIHSQKGYRKEAGEPGAIEFVAVKNKEAIQMTTQVDIPGMDFVIESNIKSFDSPVGQLKFVSKKVDLDRLMPLSTSQQPEAKASSAPLKIIAPQKKNEVIAGSDLSLKSSSALLKADLAISGTVNEIRSKGVAISDLVFKGHYKNAILSVASVTSKVLGGSSFAQGQVNLTNKMPSYSVSLDLKGLDLSQAVGSQSKLLKNTVNGLVDLKFSGQGTSWDPELAMSRFVGQGNIKVSNARFSTFDLGKALSEGLGQSMGSLIEKIPALKGQSLSGVGIIKSEYELLGGDFKIAHGVFEAPNFIAKPKQNGGFDLKGSTQVDLRDCQISADWKVKDTYNLTKARDLSFQTSGIKVDHILAKGDEPVVFPIQISGLCSEPKVNYQVLSGELVRVALDNISRGTAKKAVSELGNKLQEELGKKAGQQFKDALKGIFGK